MSTRTNLTQPREVSLEDVDMHIARARHMRSQAISRFFGRLTTRISGAAKGAWRAIRHGFDPRTVVKTPG